MKTSKFRILGVLALFLVGIMAISGVVSAVNVDLNSTVVKINGERVDKDGGDTLDIDRGEDIEIKVRFDAIGNDTNVELHAFIAGYEYGDKETLADQSSIFDVEAGITYTEELSMSLPDKLDRQLYRLRLFFADNDDPIIMSDYFLKVGTKRHEIKIKDVVLSPEHAVQAGRALIGVARLKNTGEKDEEGVKVRISVPELGIAYTDYTINELESEETKTTEEMDMRIPQCALDGTYDVVTEVTYDEGYGTAISRDSITVTEGDSCTPMASGIRVTVPASSQEVNAGEQTVFPLTIQNLGADAKQVTVSAQAGSGVEASVKEPVVVLDGEETKVVLVYARASEDASGEQLVTLKVGSGDKTQDITLKVDVNEKASAWPKVRKGLEVGLVVLVVLLVILGLIIGFNRLKGDEEESSDESGQTYY